MVTDRNEEIEYRRWRPSEPKAVLLLVHGLGAHAGRWEALGDFFAKRGIASYAIELKNINTPASSDNGPERFRRYYGKILRLYDIAVKDNPEKKIFLAGESMGALISFLLAIAKPGLFNGLICISPAFTNR
ncbi:MAG: alpha/beta fold hydrolase, partial [Candidatus Omnitrophica bacterium]|nr:alpha/beta fold hydrolase [Candidatus Omnitrophota bacterium]